MGIESRDITGKVTESGGSVELHVSRRRMLLALATLGLPACHRAKAEVAPDADVPEDPAEAGFNELLKPGQRGAFANGFVDKLKLRKTYGGFELPPGYQWKLDRAMVAAGTENGVSSVPSSQEFWITERAIMTVVLDRLFDEWKAMDMKHSSDDIFRGPYHREVYEHYRFLREAELVPERPAKASACDFLKMSEALRQRQQDAWRLTQNSPFYGNKKTLSECGSFDAPFCEAMQKLIKDLIARGPSKEAGYLGFSYERCATSSVVDMYLPGMYLAAIRQHLKLAELSPDAVGFSEEEFEGELRETFKKRAEAFLKSATICGAASPKLRILNQVGLEFKRLAEMKRPLELYEHD